jgi:two-component system sensor histidine kinase HydH
MMPFSFQGNGEPSSGADPGGRIRWFLRRYWLAIAMIAVISLLHYNTHWHIHALHGIYRRLYYFPIILAAFRGGPIGGVSAALLVIALYLPHAFGLIGFDPGTTVEKILEMLLYLLVGLLTGTLVARINAARDRQKHTAEDLRVTLDQKTAMEAELVRSARMAAVGRLSAGLAHEIRNPLASIKGSAEVLADDFSADHPKSRMFTILQEETGRLNQVLSQFLAFARSEPGEVAPFDLEQECHAVAQLMEHRPGAPSSTVTSATDVPPAFGNREQVRQVLLNLALNAAVAGGSEPAVRFEIDAPTGTVRCRVLDSGPGFTDEAVANFGTPFYSTKADGTGLGLATSLRIVEDLGGTLEVDPSFTEGGCVTLTLPAKGPGHGPDTADRR